MQNSKSRLFCKNERVWAIALLLVATLLRAWTLESRSLWFDESIEYWMGVVPISQIHSTVARATHDPPLYTYLLHQWLQLGIHEYWLRLPSLFFSILAIDGLLHLGRLAVNKQTGLWAASFLAICTADIRYAQEVGQYALLVCITVWHLVFLYLGIKKNRWRDWVWWGALVLVGLYTHYGFAIVAFTCALPFLLFNIYRREKTAVFKQITIGMGVLVGLIPLLSIISLQMNRLGAQSLPFDLHNLFSTSAKILAFPIVANVGITAWPWPHFPITIIWGVLLVLILIAIRSIRTVTHPASLLIISWLGYYLISRTGSYFFVPTRHSLLLLPLIALTIGNGIMILNQKTKVGGTVLFLSLMVVALIFPVEGEENNRLATAYWLENHQTGEPTYIYYGGTVGFRYQLDVQTEPHQGLPPNWYNVCAGGAAANYCREHDLYFGKWLRNAPADEIKASIFEMIDQSSPRLWLYFSHMSEEEENRFIDALSNEYGVISKEMFEGTAVYLLEQHNK